MRNPYEPIDVFHLARHMRKNMTKTESLLWQRLRARRLGGFKFLRQHVVHGFIADFYCHELRLLVEVDGEVHEQMSACMRDNERDFQLAAHGYYTLRIRDSDVLINIDMVCLRILDTIYHEISLLVMQAPP